MVTNNVFHLRYRSISITVQLQIGWSQDQGPHMWALMVFSSPIYKIGGLMLSPRRRRWDRHRHRRRRRRRRCWLNLYIQGLSSDTIALKLHTLIQEH